MNPGNPVDLATSAQADAWLRHPVLGDPSFDAFERVGGQPLYRGRPPRAWAVNGFLFDDPQGGGLFAYVGRYPEGYACGPGVVRSDCVVLRSRDGGVTWEEIGPVFSGEFTFAGDTVGANNTPDVSVVYADGRYHLAYDWGHDTATWASAFNPRGNDDSGMGYAWAERPEGPFHRHPVPIYRNSIHRSPVPGKYRRVYASTLLRRERDWLLLSLSDSGPGFAWGLYALTAPRSEGPWAEPRLVLSLEGDGFHPALMEFFPAFVLGDEVFCPATSVALNRNFQCLWAAPLAQAQVPEAWRLRQHGSLWHAADAEAEHHGLWGQTFSGQVGADGRLRALFPSRDRAGNGTIGLAVRPWRQPCRERGFVLSGHAGASLALTKAARRAFNLRVRATVRGTARIVWGWAGGLGPDRHGADATLHPLVRTSHQALEWGAATWRVLQVYARGAETELAGGTWAEAATREVAIELSAAGRLSVRYADRELWSGPVALAAGPCGWLVEADTHVSVERFELAGEPVPGRARWHLLDAFLATGVREDDWERSADAGSPGGEVACARGAGGRLKWNFTGTGVRWWAPRGPGLARVRIKVDGVVRGDVDLSAASPQPAGVAFACDDLADGHHALVIEAMEGRLATGGLEVAGA